MPLVVTPDFITKDEEKAILSQFRKTATRKGRERNHIIRYGSSLPYNYKEKGIPPYFGTVIGKILSFGYKIDSVTINEYHLGQGIDWHIDSPSSGDVIIVLSLLSSAQMGVDNDNGLTVFTLPPRSLTIMDGEDRWFKHCIYPVEDKRYSIVFRHSKIIK